jgi:colicin import membrane protein
MKTTEVQGQPIDPVKEPFATYLVLSAAVHGALVVCVVTGAWWLGMPTYYKPSSYTVSLVDAPLTLRTPSPSVSSKTSSEAPKASLNQQASMPTPLAPEPPPGKRAATPPAAKPAVATKAMTAPQRNTPTVAPTPPSAKTAKTTPAPQKKPPKTVSPAKSQTAARAPSKRSRSASATAAEARRAVTTLRQRQAKTASGTTPAQQRAAEQRLASLRERFGRDATGNAVADATAGLQQVRLRAYLERVREHIIDVWILPLPQEEARHLQATALLTFGRDGRIAQLNLLKTSGNPLFDDSVLRAIRQAEPLPAPPEDYGGEVVEMEMRFRPGDT